MRIDSQRSGAVIYTRVSTEEQASGSQNLLNQQKRCADFCTQHGLTVKEIFVDPGESARSKDRPEFQRMLDFCRVQRHVVGYVIVQDLSRFARNLEDQAATIAELKKHGILLRSVYESNIDETAAGRLAANIHGTFNQFFSDSLSEKMRDRMRDAVLAGRFPWPAPLGYVNVQSRGQQPNIVPDTKRAPLVREAFLLMETGLYSKASVLAKVSELGLRTRKSKPLSPQTFHSMLMKPVYCGWVSPRSHPDLRVKGLHEPLVSENTFLQVQQVLSGRKPIVAARKKLNPNFPLKAFVKCAECGTPLTGGSAKGRSKRYGHYWCHNSECRATKLRQEKLEKEFLLLLNRLQPNPEVASSFSKIAAKVWSQKQGDANSELKCLAAKLDDIRQLKSELLKQKLRGEVQQRDYEEANREYTLEIEIIEQQISLARSNVTTLEAFVRFAELMLVNIAGAWLRATAEQRQRVQNLLFPEGIQYSMREGFLNRSNPSLFNMLEDMTSEKGMLASPTGFEPVLPP